MIRLRVHIILQERSISMGKLSRAADIPLSTVRRIVREPGYQPRLETLVKLSRYLHVSMDELYYDDEETH